jgi:hypothetical protein
MRWTGSVEFMGGKWNAYRISSENSERNSLLGRPRLRSEFNVEMDYKDDGVEGWTGFIRLGIGRSGGLL